jgi:hypothetical protein
LLQEEQTMTVPVVSTVGGYRSQQVRKYVHSIEYLASRRVFFKCISKNTAVLIFSLKMEAECTFETLETLPKFRWREDPTEQ